MKYRRLSTDELQELEKEFVHFLVSNGIIAGDWVKLKEEENEKAETLIDAFSDIVMEKVLSKVEFLEKRERSSVLFFHALKDSFEVIGISCSDPSLDLTKEETIKELAQEAKGIDLFTTSQRYHKSRAIEIFELTELGSFVTNGKLFQVLKENESK